jgi:glycosyltransferase involved in cell wall biosynthesis
LVVIDNGSNDGTGAYLAGVQDAASVPLTVISNDRNIGFPAAINQGLKVAQGEYLVLLNNDAVVTDGWLDQLVALAEIRSELTTEHAARPSRSRNLPSLQSAHGAKKSNVSRTESTDGGLKTQGIGLVGPMSNYA